VYIGLIARCTLSWKIQDNNNDNLMDNKMKGKMQLAHDLLMIEKLEEKLYDNYDRGYMLREYLSISPNDQEAKKELNRLINEKLEIELKIKLYKA